MRLGILVLANVKRLPLHGLSLVSMHRCGKTNRTEWTTSLALMEVKVNHSKKQNNMSDEKWPKHKDHLNKTYLEELAHKLWNTKGTRFVASARLLTMNDLSNKALGFLSAYLIIFGLLSVYQIKGTEIIDSNVIAFGSTALSILLLVFTQMEAAQDFKIRAQQFHKCALEISELHDRVRMFKTMRSPTEEDKIAFCEEITLEYQEILRSYPNHDSIDYDYFRCRHLDYYDLSTWWAIRVNGRYYLRTKLLYHVLIGFPVIGFKLIWILSM